MIAADPGEGAASPAHGMASQIVYSGGPRHCIDADHAPEFARLFQLAEPTELQRELARFVKLKPEPDHLVWVICTSTYDGDGVALAQDRWQYLASWSDGGWLYTVRATSAAERERAVAALADSINQLGTGS